MIYSAARGGEQQSPDPSRGWTLVMLSTAVSIDALAVGLSLGVLGVSIWYPALVIGVVTSALSLVALRLGRTIGSSLGRPVEILGGLVLLGIGIRSVLQHVG